MRRKKELGCGGQMIIVSGWLAVTPLVFVVAWVVSALGFRDMALGVGVLVGLFVVMQVTNYVTGVLLVWIGESD